MAVAVHLIVKLKMLWLLHVHNAANVVHVKASVSALEFCIKSTILCVCPIAQCEVLQPSRHHGAIVLLLSI